MKKVLLTVSGTVPPDIETRIKAGQRPEADYVAMANAFQADIIDFSRAMEFTGWFGKVLKRINPVLVLSWACFLLRNKYQLIFTDGEQVGIPLALLTKFFSPQKRPKHFMIVHVLSRKKKIFFFDIFHIQNQIDHYFVYSTFQKGYIEKRLRIPDGQVTFTPFMVDHHFFSPESSRKGDPLGLLNGSKPMICSVGLEYRDYVTLIEAVRGIDAKLVIAAASPWSKRKDHVQEIHLPENIVINKFSQYDLRDLYSASNFMVMPLEPVEFQAGVTAILEAMSMGKAVICSRTPGQTDVIEDGKTGVYVSPKDPAALRQAILDLVSQPEKARSLGTAGRQVIVETMSLEQYTQRLKQYVDACVCKQN